MKAIAAMDENRGMGYKNNIPWNVKEDFKWFKEFTTNKILVMGRKTFETLPPLKNRNIIVLTKFGDAYEDVYEPINNSANCHRLFGEIITIDQVQPNLICAGGAKTYEVFLPFITEFYVTHIKGTYDADVYMPAFEHLFTKQEVVKEFDGHRVVCYSK